MKAPVALALFGLSSILNQESEATMKHGKGVNYIPTTTKSGRRFVAAKGSVFVHKDAPPTAFADHNKAIEEKRLADLAARKAKREANGK